MDDFTYYSVSILCTYYIGGKLKISFGTVYEYWVAMRHALIAFDNIYSPEISVTSDYFSNIQSLGTFLLKNTIKININMIVNSVLKDNSCISGF